jgi:hypothetical protein
VDVTSNIDEGTTMRIHDDRYTHERLRFHVALRFIRLEARTRTIRQWTGLSDDRIRKLHRSYLAHSGSAVPRHRGKSPRRISAFLRSARLREESSLLASLYRLLGAVPDTPRPARGASLQQAQRLCDAYEMYRALIVTPALGFEHAVFLLEALSEQAELTCVPCPDCRALMVMDRWGLYAPRCAPCVLEAGGDWQQARADVRQSDLPATLTRSLQTLRAGAPETGRRPSPSSSDGSHPH